MAWDLPLLGPSSLPGVRSIPDAPPSPQPMAALCPSHSCLLLPVPLSSGSIPHSSRLLQSPYSSVTPVSLFEFISSVLPESSFQTPISWHPSPALQSKVYFFLLKIGVCCHIPMTYLTGLPTCPGPPPKAYHTRSCLGTST